MYTVYFVYLDSKIEIEAEKTSEWNADNVIASNIHIRHICLPSTPDSHTFYSYFKSVFTINRIWACACKISNDMHIYNNT